MFYWLLFIIPKKLLSRTVGVLADTALPSWILKPLLKWFVHHYRINLEESKLHLDQFKTLNELFTRELKMELRPLGATPYVHPADSRLVASGEISNGLKLQLKKVPYQLDQMLPGYDASLFQSGKYALYYLCPTDYHRVHSPVDGKIKTVTHIPGLLWPVNQWSSETINGLFYKNERVIIEIETINGLVMVILVAATNVSQMSLSFDASFRKNSLRATRLTQLTYSNCEIKKGQELGIFHMGSTVVVLLSTQFTAANRFDFPANGSRVKVRQGVTG
jgi:phosphatidylserine decarboxylase